jgi:hypothetical protein
MCPGIPARRKGTSRAEALKGEVHSGKTYSIEEEGGAKQRIRTTGAAQIPNAGRKSRPKREGARIADGASRQTERSRQEKDRLEGGQDFGQMSRHEREKPIPERTGSAAFGWLGGLR